MKYQIESRGVTASLLRAVNRHHAAPETPAEPPSPRRRLRALLRSGEHGQAMVEFALVLPALLLVTTGIMIFGVAMNNYLELTNAVGIGARQVAVYGHDSGTSVLTTDPCSVASSAVIAAAPGLNSSLLTFTYSFNGVPASTTSCTSAAANLLSGTNVTVTATYPFTLIGYNTIFSQSNAVMTASTTELVQ